MRTGWLLASLGVSLMVVGCGSSSGGGTGGSGGHAGTIGTGGHTGGSGGHAGSGGTAGAAGGHAGTGGTAGAAGGTAGAAGGHAGSGGAGGSAGAGGTAGAAGGHAGTGGKAGAGGAVGGQSGAAGGQSGAAGGAAGAGGAGGLAVCGASNAAPQGLSCNQLDPTGPCVQASTGTGAPPTAAGGTIQTGTYDLTSITVYPGDGAFPTILSPVRKTIVIAHPPGGGGDLMMDESDAAGSNYESRSSGTLTTSGTNVTFTQTCPPVDAGTPSPSGYTATTGATPMITVIENHGSYTQVEVWQQR